MTDSQKPVDPKAVGQAFSQMIRDQRNLQRVRVTPATSLDSLNDALRRAGGREEDGGDDGPDEPGSYPWRSLQSQDGGT